MTGDRREFPRHQVRKNGKIVFMDQPFFVECVIRNISQDGALLSMLVPVALPQDVLLWEQNTNRLYECVIRWRRDHMVGVQFIHARDGVKRQTLLKRCFVPIDSGQEQPPPRTH
jgi:hypothetical protein